MTSNAIRRAHASVTLTGTPRLMRVVIGVGLAVGLFGACASTGGHTWQPATAMDTRDEPAALRPGFGNPTLHTWWPLTAPEVAAVGGLARAKQGDAHALLALAILASADPRDDAGYARIQQRVDQFVAELKPAMDAAPDDWHRGYELNRAMHRVFFRGERAERAGRAELGGYQLGQSRLTAIFTGGQYNCLSSAMLYVVLARAFDLPVRAAVVPTHVFVELGKPGGKIVDVETTSATGFDWVHDARFYADDAASWSSRRGLRPVTLDEYQHRSIVEPHRLMALGMRNSHDGESETDRARLIEVAALVDGDDVEAQRDRLRIYNNEAYGFEEAKSWRTMVRLFDTVSPTILETRERFRDPQTLQLASWLYTYYAFALTVVGRDDEATAIMSDGLDHLDPGWDDAAKLRNNFLEVLNSRFGDLLSKKDYAGAAKLLVRYRDPCRTQQACASNGGAVYLNWSIEHQNAGDWRAARQVLQECVAELPDDARCTEALKELESRHTF